MDLRQRNTHGLETNLIDHPYLMLHPLCVQEAGDVGRKLHQLLIPGIGIY